MSWSRDGIFLHLVTLSVNPIIYYAILFLVEYIYEVKKINSYRSKIYPLKEVEKDPMYVKEKNRIKELTWVEKNDYRVVVDRLEGEMQHSSFFHTVSFTLDEGEILGIIGLPNAGRRELCYKIAGLSRYTHGDIFIEGRDLRTSSLELPHLSVAFHKGGFLKGMHVKNVLRVVCMCRGVPNKLISPLINELCHYLSLKDYLHSNHGMNRRTNIAIALVANINIMVLDEPTTFMDPLTRDIIWQTLLFARKLGKTIIFSASSFYEAQALSDRIIFHVNGGVYGLGPLQELRSRITKAICVEIQLVRDGRNAQETAEK